VTAQNETNNQQILVFQRCTVYGTVIYDMREAIFHDEAKEALKGFPKAARAEIGWLIERLQAGDTLVEPLSKPMNMIALSCHELRYKDETGAYRTFYYLKHERGILIFHAFKKKTQKTPKKELETGRQRLKSLLKEIEDESR
jgi:phage-related protein